MNYKINDKEFDSLSSSNQTILQQLVEKNIYCCMSQEIEYILKTEYMEGFDDDLAPFTSEDVENLTDVVCDECGELGLISKENLNDLKNPHEKYTCHGCGKIFSDDEYNCLDYDEAEVFEWWAVHPWFGNKLKEKDQVVIESYGKTYWGRQTTGQAILLDCVISEIAIKMQILEGQKYSWKK